MRKYPYLQYLTEAEIQVLCAAVQSGYVHPTANLALAEGANRVGATTELAARSIHEENPHWLLHQRARLLDTTDFTNASSALGEIRAYGALLEAGLRVRPTPSVNGKAVLPDFEVDAGDGTAIVEVHSRQMAPTEREALADFHQELARKAEENRTKGKNITMDHTDIAPLGHGDPAKAGDSVLTNAISKIASIKQNEKQIDATKPFVLWLDLQDPTVWGLPVSDAQLAPCFTDWHDGQVGAGAFWYALYGQKDDPMLDMGGCDYVTRPMLHDGRFVRPTNISAVVLSLPDTTVLMEHPAANKPLSPLLRAGLIRLPYFKMELSLMEWRPGLVKDMVALQHASVDAAAAALLATNSP